MQYILGDVVKLKKDHACGSNNWQILRTGVDFKLKCLNCEKILWLKRTDFNKAVRKIKDENNKYVSIKSFNREF